MLNSATICRDGRAIILNSNTMLELGSFKAPYKKVRIVKNSIPSWERLPNHIKERYTLLNCDKFLRSLGFN